MAKHYVVINENGIVTNIIVELPKGMDGICVDGLDVSIGDRYENGEFIKANPPEEPSIEDQIAALMAQIESLKSNK